MRKPLEKDIQRVIMDWLHLRGALPIRINSAAFVGKATDQWKRRFIRSNSEAGCADILCCFPPRLQHDIGRFVAIEVKRPGGKPSEKQQAFADRVRRAGGIAVTVTGLEDLVKQLIEAGVIA